MDAWGAGGCRWVGGWVEWKYILAVKEGGELYTGFENPD